MTQWKDIPGYEGVYQASDDGRIRSTASKTTYTKKHGIRHWRQRELKQKRSYSGYRVSLWNNGVQRDCLVARLIATTFLENLMDTNMTVNHIDGNRSNNNVGNLEWLSRADNIRHGFRSGLYANNQRPITLINDNSKLCFASMAEASRYLMQNNKYIYSKLRNGTSARSKDGTVYTICEGREIL